jgi:hypothetical protein
LDQSCMEIPGQRTRSEEVSSKQTGLCIFIPLEMKI